MDRRTFLQTSFYTSLLFGAGGLPSLSSSAHAAVAAGVRVPLPCYRRGRAEASRRQGQREGPAEEGRQIQVPGPGQSARVPGI